jgi:hypothetical protein
MLVENQDVMTTVLTSLSLPREIGDCPFPPTAQETCLSGDVQKTGGRFYDDPASMTPSSLSPYDAVSLHKSDYYD